MLYVYGPLEMESTQGLQAGWGNGTGPEDMLGRQN